MVNDALNVDFYWNISCRLNQVSIVKYALSIPSVFYVS